MNLSSYLPLLVDLMLKSAVLVGVAMLAARFARSASAANRNLIWLAAIGQVLALPFLGVWVSAERERSPATDADTAIIVTLPVRKSSTGDASPTVVVADPVSPLRAALAWGRDHWRDGVVGVWLGVAAALLVWRFVGSARLRSLRRRSALAGEDRIAACALRLAGEQALRRRVELRISAECPVAMTWGTWRPVVMLPADARGWSEQRLELVLRHELAHVARRDCLARLLSQVACALCWPNPLVWLAARRLRLTQEQACDDRVITAGVESKTYATELLAAARMLADKGWSGAAVAMAEPSTLTKRIVGIVDEGRERGDVLRSTAVLTVVAAALALTGCSALRVREGGPAAPVQGADARAVEVETMIVQFPPDAPETKAVLEELEKMDAYASANREVRDGLAPSAADALVRDLGKRVGADFMSSPKITVRSGQLATFTLAHEMQFPPSAGHALDVSAGSTPSGAGTAVTSGEPIKNLGVEMKALPRIGTDGGIALQLTAIVTEFEGFVEFGGGSPTDGATVDSAVYQPIFSTRETTVAQRVASGRAIIFKLGQLKRIHQPTSAKGSHVVTQIAPDDPKENIVLVFVTATEVSLPKTLANAGAETSKSNF